MHVRFSVPHHNSIRDLDQIVYEIGSPKLLFFKGYFYADIHSDKISKLQHLKVCHYISSIAYVDYLDDLPVGISKDGD